MNRFPVNAANARNVTNVRNATNVTNARNFNLHRRFFGNFITNMALLSSGNKTFIFKDCNCAANLDDQRFSSSFILGWRFLEKFKTNREFKATVNVILHKRKYCGKKYGKIYKKNGLKLLGRTVRLEVFHSHRNDISCKDSYVNRNCIIFNKDFTKCNVYLDKLNFELRRHLVKAIFYFYYLFDANCLLLHSAAVKYNNEGFVFLGPSGAGKSTIAGFFHQRKNAVVLNEDCNMVYKNGRVYRIKGIFCHPLGIMADSRPTAKISYIFFLNKRPMFAIRKIKKIEALRRISRCEIPRFNRLDANISKKFNEITDFLLGLLDNVETYELDFKKDRAVVPFISKWIRREKGGVHAKAFCYQR